MSRASRARAHDLAALADHVAEVARWAAAHERPTVFCSPVATFASRDRAAMENMGNGPAITLDVDSADPREALRVLRAVPELGKPTSIVSTGSVWTCPATGAAVPKQHHHWRLSAPMTTPAEHDRLREARHLAAILADADRSLASPVHPQRWPGSLNRKAAPALAVIETIDAGREVRLDAALDASREAVEATGRDHEAAYLATRTATPPVSSTERVARATSALEWIPNDDLTRDEWVRVAYALHAATGGAAEGLDTFITFSRKSTKHTNAGTPAKLWDSVAKAPPRHITEATLYGLAQLHRWPGWTPEPPATPDEYYAAVAQDDRAKPYVHAARSAGSAGAPAESDSTESGPAECDSAEGADTLTERIDRNATHLAVSRDTTARRWARAMTRPRRAQAEARTHARTRHRRDIAVALRVERRGRRCDDQRQVTSGDAAPHTNCVVTTPVDASPPTADAGVPISAAAAVELAVLTPS